MPALPWLFALLVLSTGPSPPAGLAWCYRTLADVVCYRRPDRDHPDRLVGVARCGDPDVSASSGCTGPPAADGSRPDGGRRDTEGR